MSYTDYDVDADPKKYEDEGLNVDQGVDPNEGTRKSDYLEELEEDDD